MEDMSGDLLEDAIDPMGIEDVIGKALQGEDFLKEDEEKLKELLPLYYYEKLDHGYYLFSNGKDQLPFTQDDIFPEITGNTNNGLQIPNN
ncbi:MAG: hypothetical protein GXP45_02185 [bacterium]|nr:hypothetical protein [bacterium]